MTAVLYLMLLFLQQCNSEETLFSPNNKTLQVNITSSEETLLANIASEETSLVNITTCEKLADMCTYTLPRILEKERGYDQCQVTLHIRGKFTLSIFVKLVIRSSIPAKDKRVRENQGFFVANSLVVILVGTFTNLFNLVAFAYIYFA